MGPEARPRGRAPDRFVRVAEKDSEAPTTSRGGPFPSQCRSDRGRGPAGREGVSGKRGEENLGFNRGSRRRGGTQNDRCVRRRLDQTVLQQHRRTEMPRSRRGAVEPVMQLGRKRHRLREQPKQHHAGSLAESPGRAKPRFDWTLQLQGSCNLVSRSRLATGFCGRGQEAHRPRGDGRAGRRACRTTAGSSGLNAGPRWRWRTAARSAPPARRAGRSRGARG